MNKIFRLATFSFLAILLSAADSYAFKIDCKAVKVYDTSYLEEGLSVDEYPDVTLTPEKVWLGSSLYTLDDGAIITLKPSVGFRKTVEVINASGHQKFNITVNLAPNNKTGILMGTDLGEDKAPRKIADLVCK